MYARLKQGTGIIKEAFKMATHLVECEEGLGEWEGLLGDVKKILRVLKLRRYWEEENIPKKAKWKEIVNEPIDHWE